MPKHKGPGPTNGENAKRPALRLVKGSRGTEDDLMLGKTIQGRYRITGLVSTDGMARDYKASSADGSESFMLKLLRNVSDGHSTDEALYRFMREATISQRLNPEHIVPIEDLGMHEGRVFIVTPYLEGRNLQEMLKGDGPLPWAQLKVLMAQACKGLGAMHGQGLYHRNVKPANLLLTEKGTLKVLVSGIAKYHGSYRDSMETHPGIFVGVPTYCSPEQVSGKHKVDQRADIYSLGVVMYEMLTGSIPFRGENVMETLFMHVEDKPQRPGQARPDLDIPKEAEAIVLRCLEKDPADRFQGMDELQDAIQGI
jgi:serine/threonine-protein kinase